MFVRLFVKLLLINRINITIKRKVYFICQNVIEEEMKFIFKFLMANQFDAWRLLLTIGSGPIRRIFSTDKTTFFRKIEEEKQIED